MPVVDALRQQMQPLASVVNSHRLLLYSLVSCVAVSAAIANALKNHSNFYSVAIYLSRSSRSVLVLANFGLLQALLVGRVVQQIFFGPLRPMEVERLYDRLWFFVTESLLAFTIFRDEFDITFGLMFGLLLFVKSFHWLASDRIEWMDQRPYPGPPTLFHIRMNALFMVLWSIDFIMFAFAVESIVTHGVGGMVLFASEYTILMASALNTMAKYVLSVVEIRRAHLRGGENAPPWENKSMYVFYIELVTDFLKLATYLAFFALIITFYGLPLNILRDVYITARSFITRLRALHRYQTATRNMDQRYPNATEEELSAMSDHTCIICREEMAHQGASQQAPAQNGHAAPNGPVPQNDGPNMTPKKLPCGHIFHFHCLRSWLERQQSCPTCRRTVLEDGQPGAAPQAQPGAQPQPPNMFAGQGVQAPPQGQQQPQAFVRGVLGRMLGVPPPPPATPGATPGPQQNGNAPYVQRQAPGITIHINYDYQRQQPIRPQSNPQGAPQPQAQPQPQPQAQPRPAPRVAPRQAPLRPAPQYEGFRGPGGEWQPWGMDQRWFGAGPRNPTPNAPRPERTTSAPAHAQTATDAPAPTPTTQAPPAFSPPTSPPLPGPNGELPPSSSARAAAAQAALDRLKRVREGTSSSDDTRTGTPTAGPTAGASVASTSTSTPDPSAPPNSTRSRISIPQLIPLHDTLSPPTPAPAPYDPLGQARPSLGPRTGSAPIPRQPLPLSELPASLTDEQLALMDTLTREAIDERLRVLEGVSGAVYRCMEDLTRMRSNLPASTAPSAATSPSMPSAAAPSSMPTAVAQPSMSSSDSAPSQAESSSAASTHSPQTSEDSGELVDANS